MDRDWIGNKGTTYAILGASNHSNVEREKDDYYATDPDSLKLFLSSLKRDNIILHSEVWECACGGGHLSKVLEENGYRVKSTDLVDRGYGQANIDFLQAEQNSWNGDILTNPPYKYALDFVKKGLEVVSDGDYVIMFLKIQFLEGKERRNLFNEYPPKYVYVNSERQTCYLGGNVDNKMKSATCYCWFIWQKNYKSEPIIRWI